MVKSAGTTSVADLVPLYRQGKPSGDRAAFFVFLASDESSYVNAQACLRMEARSTRKETEALFILVSPIRSFKLIEKNNICSRQEDDRR